MAEKATDPFAMWHRFLGDFETGSNSFLGKAMQTPEFSQAMNQVSGMSAAAQKALAEAMEKYLVTMNLPSRAQLVGLGERLQSIESQLAEIKAMLARMDAGGAASDHDGVPRPPRTKQPPAKGTPS